MKDYRLQVLVYSLIVIFLLSTVYCQLSTVYAVNSTPSADIQSKVNEFIKQAASKAAMLAPQISKKLQDKAYVGKVKTKSSNSLTLAARTGPKIVSINQDTVYASNIKGSTKFSQKMIEEEDYLTALGDVDENGVLTAKKIILLNPNPYTLDPKTFLWGQIISISDKLVTLKDKSLKSVAVSLQDPSLVKISDFVILTGSKNKNEIFKAEFVFNIPQGGILRPKKVATQSAKKK